MSDVILGVITEATVEGGDGAKALVPHISFYISIDLWVHKSTP